jgi:hypothetical protein
MSSWRLTPDPEDTKAKLEEYKQFHKDWEEREAAREAKQQELTEKFGPAGGKHWWS